MKKDFFLVIFLLCLLCFSVAAKKNDDECENSEETNLQTLALTSITCGALVGGGGGLLGIFFTHASKFTFNPFPLHNSCPSSSN